MGWQAWYTLGVVALIFLALARNLGPADALLMAGTLACTLGGVINAKDAFGGFANEAMLTVGALFVVAAALRETGVMDRLGRRMLGRITTSRGALLRMTLWMNTLMVFMNNTSIVAMLLPVITDWCRKNRVAPSKLLIPLSFLTVMRGMTTLIGTTTNLVVSGFLLQAAASEANPVVRQQLRPISMFEVTPLGIAVVLAGSAYVLLTAERLLPDRKDLLERLDESARGYLVDMLVQPQCALAGQTVEQAGLRRLPGLYLIEIARNGQVIAPVGPDQQLKAGDRLTFTGVVGSIVDLERIPGLVAATDDSLGQPERLRRGRRLCEAVISATSPLVGKTIRGADFRALYNAAVIAVHRGGERLQGRVGDIELRPGDTLLLQTGPHFARAHRNNQDFVLVSTVEESRPVRHERAPWALGILALFVVLAVSGKVEIVVCAFLAAALMIGTRCISSSDARESVNWQTLITIGASFGLGKALEKSGAAQAMAHLMVHSAGAWGPVAVLAALYFCSMLFSSIIAHNAAAALMFPFALAVSQQMGVSPRPFAIAIMFGASLSFATPMGYQTNLMVYGPGGYKFTDFVRIGLPLNLLLWLVAVLLIPHLWAF